MRRICSHLLVMMAFVFLVSVRAPATPPVPPAPTQWVTDTAGFMTDGARSSLNAKLEAYEQTSKHQVLVWIGKSTSGDSIEDWAVRSFQAWKVGRKGLDDGLVLFIFSDDHTVRIEVGYGLEGVATDSATSRILRETILPKIKAGDHDGAIVGGVDKIVALLSPGAATNAGQGTSAVGNGGNGNASTQPMPWYEVLVLVLLGIAVLWFAIRHPMFSCFLLSVIGRNNGGGGGRSGGGGASGKW